MQFSGAKGAFPRIGVVGRIETDFPEPHPGAVPVVGIAHHRQVLVGPPAGEQEGSVAHEVSGASPRGPLAGPSAEALDDSAGNRDKGSPLPEDGEEIGLAMIEPNFKGSRIDRPQAERIRRPILSGVVIVRAGDTKAINGLGAGEAGLENPPETVKAIVGGQR